MLADDGFSKLLATGLTAVFALQAFVIVGGVTRVIPLTGVTLPFVSYGGSSIVANFVLLALLLMVSQRGARAARRGASPVVPVSASRERPHPPPVRARRAAVRLLVGFTSYWSVFDADGLEANTRQQAPAARAAAHPARADLRRATAPCWPATGSTGTGLSRASTAASIRPATLFAHPVGYNFVERGRVGPRAVVQRRADRRARTSSTTLFDELRGKEREGDDLRHDARPAARSGRRSQALAGRAGSVVAIEPQTGRVLRDGERAGLRPEPTSRTRFAELNRDARLAALQPRDAERLSAGLDLQGRDRDGGARQRPLHARSRCSTASRRR